MYASFDSIRATLDFDFSQEKNSSYEGLSIEEAIRHYRYKSYYDKIKNTNENVIDSLS